MDINKSVLFIDEKGSSLEKARIRWILYRVKPQPDVIRSLIKLQNLDGGFPYDMVNGNLSTVNETTVALWWMEELNLISSVAANQAYAYLLATQKDDGSWDEDPAIAQYDLPPWISLGDLKTRLYLSAYATYWLAVRGYSDHHAFQKAIHFLLQHQDETGKFYGYLHTTWIAISVFLMAGELYNKIARLGLQALSAKALSEWDDSQIAWAMDCLSQGGLPKDHPFAQDCLSELVQRQKPDGSWASEDGEGFAVGATIQAVKVLKRYGLLNIGSE